MGDVEGERPSPPFSLTQEFDGDHLLSNELRLWVASAEVADRRLPPELRQGKTGSVVRGLNLTRMGQLAAFKTARVESLPFGSIAAAEIRRIVSEECLKGMGPGADPESGLIFDEATRKKLAGVAGRPIPAGVLSPRVIRTLMRSGVRTLGDLGELTIRRVLKIHGAGAKTVEELRASAAALLNPPERPPSREVSPPPRPRPPAQPRVAEQREYLVGPTLRDEMRTLPLSGVAIPLETLPTRTRNVLVRQNIVTFGAIAQLTVRDVLRMRGLGVNAVRDLQELLPRAVLAARTSVVSSVQPAISAMAEEQDVRVVRVSPIGGETSQQRPLDLLILEQLPPLLRQRLVDERSVLERIKGNDRRFGVKGFGAMSLWELLNCSAKVPPEGTGSEASLEARLALLVDRLEDPTYLQAEIDEILPPADRNARMTRMRLGFDGAGPRTLEETAQEFNLTRERVRQVEQKLKRRQSVAGPVFLPTAERLVRLLEEMGGAILEDELAVAAQDRGLVREAGEVAALPGLFDFGLIPVAVRRVNVDGRPVLVLGDQEVSGIGVVAKFTRKAIARRGICPVSQVAGSLEDQGLSGSEADVRAFIRDDPDLDFLAAGAYFWCPSDDDSRFARGLHKPLAVVGPLSTAALLNALIRSSYRRGRDIQVPTEVLREAITRARYLIEDQPGVWSWAGRRRVFTLGVAEAPLLELLRAEGPVLTGDEIRSRLTYLEEPTLDMALGSSPLVERVARNVYAVTGSSPTPAEVVRAVHRARAAGKLASDKQGDTRRDIVE